ncbi:MAG: preprotein translocase subunit SecE [Candidatus Berkelbacteria bacterium]|nr:MAG: preprotein translocase subunit SecE [Candidatus Berkelbacteria bacterium]QQG51455.1 MAG: preprotein translocase subunit SecE [Candidatus Berkelbacteria bacterium]
MARIAAFGYLKSTVEEGRKVVWPTRETVVRHTIMVVVSVAVAVLIFASLDYGLKKLVILAIER